MANEHEKQAAAVAAELDAALRALGIDLGWGVPRVAGSERAGTTRIELHFACNALQDGLSAAARLVSILRLMSPASPVAASCDECTRTDEHHHIGAVAR